jgi:hypothetical protein
MPPTPASTSGLRPAAIDIPRDDPAVTPAYSLSRVVDRQLGAEHLGVLSVSSWCMFG